LGKGFLTGFRYGGDLGALMASCRRQGLLVHRAGLDVLRLLPPINISAAEITELIDRLDRAMVK
jgi:acetylornithine/succinyldiaminopimelate/putrescine aminotransferase